MDLMGAFENGEVMPVDFNICHRLEEMENSTPKVWETKEIERKNGRRRSMRGSDGSELKKLHGCIRRKSMLSNQGIRLRGA